MVRRCVMKLNIDKEKLFRDGGKNPAVLAGAVILYGACMAAAVIKSIQERQRVEEKADSE